MTRWWLYYRMFLRLCVFQRQLQTTCSWFKKKKALNAASRAIQQIVFEGVVGGADNTKIRLYTILKKSFLRNSFTKDFTKEQ